MWTGRRQLLPAALLLWLGAGVAVHADGPAVPEAVRVLWIGNSYTGNGHLHELVTQMINEGPTPMHMVSEASVHGGKNFKYHVESTPVLDRIRDGTFDFVVLQNHSLSTLSGETRAQMHDYADRLVRAVRVSGAEPVFYCTWARAHMPETQQIITQTYQILAADLDAEFAPVGPAWERALRERPDLPLHAVDQSHPNAHGVYLNACIFYAVFTGESPVGHPIKSVRIHRRDPDTGKRLTNITTVVLADDVAAFLQGVAGWVVRPTGR